MVVPTPAVEGAATTVVAARMVATMAVDIAVAMVVDTTAVARVPMAVPAAALSEARPPLAARLRPGLGPGKATAAVTFRPAGTGFREMAQIQADPVPRANGLLVRQWPDLPVRI